MNKDAKYLPDIFFCTKQKWLRLTNIDLWSMKRTHNWCCIRGICWDNRAVIDPWIKKDIGKIPCYYSFGGNFVLFISLLVIFWLQRTFLVVLKTVLSTVKELCLPPFHTNPVKISFLQLILQSRVLHKALCIGNLETDA